MKSPGTYYNPAIEYAEATRAAWRGRPLFSQPSFALPIEIDGEPRVLHVEMLRPRRRRRAASSSRVKVNGAVFSLAVITPTGSEESFLDVMFEDADPLHVRARRAALGGGALAAPRYGGACRR